MSDLVFYTNPQSRGQIVRWMLEEVGEPYETRLLAYGAGMKDEAYLAVNPMGKVPAIVHKGKAVTEAAAICAYLADAFPAAGLAPDPADRADYYRFLFFAAGPLEAGFSNKAAGWIPSEEQQTMFGYGSFDRTVNALARLLEGRDYITGRFSAADLYVGSELDFMLRFKVLDPQPVFTDYVARVTDREAYRRAQEIDARAAGEASTS